MGKGRKRNECESLENIYIVSKHLPVWQFLIAMLSCCQLLSQAQLSVTPYIDSLLVIPFANIFFLSAGCLFFLLIISFTMKNLLCFIRSHSLIFAFVSFALGDRLKKILLHITSKIVQLTFFQRSCMELYGFRCYIKVFNSFLVYTQQSYMQVTIFAFFYFLSVILSLSLYVLYIYIYIYIYIHTHTHTHIYTWTYIIYMCIFTCTFHDAPLLVNSST